MRNARFWVVVTLLLLVSAPVLAADWPNFLGPNRDGISTETGINKDWKARPPKVLWKIPMGDGGFAGPSVAGGKIFIIDHERADDVVRAIDVRTAKDVWTFRYRDLRRSNYGFSQSTPTVDGDRVYTLSRLAKLHCLAVADGKKLWSRDLVREFGARLPKWQSAASPVIDGDRVIVAPGGRDACVVAFDKKTGKVIWQGGGGDVPGYATPVVATIGGVKQYLVFTGRALVGVNAANGKRLWRFPWKTRYDVHAATPVVSGDTVFITSDYKRGCALVRIDGGRARAVWENKSIQSHFSTPVLSGGHLYSTSDPNRTVCLELKTGKTKWEERGGGKGGVVAVDGALLVVDGSSGSVTMVELSAAGYKPLGRIKPLGGQSWTAPIIADGKLILRNKNSLACLDLK